MLSAYTHISSEEGIYKLELFVKLMHLINEDTIKLNRKMVNFLQWISIINFIVSEEKSAMVTDSYICLRFFQEAHVIVLTHAN